MSCVRLRPVIRLRAVKKLRHITQLAIQLWSRLGTLTKVIGALTAALGLATAGVTAYTTAGDYFVRRAEVEQYIAVAAQQLASGDYRLAWQTNENALKIAPHDGPAKSQQILIAMRWLEDMRLSSAIGQRSFSEVVEPLELVLIGHAAKAQGVELADLKAHIGWARFLRSRDGVSGLRIIEEYDDALRIDPQNMYARVLRGFLTLWNGGSLDQARDDLDSALRSSVDPGYTDRMIIAALFNVTTDENLCGAIEYANRIRKLGRDISGSKSRADILLVYERGLSNPAFLALLAKSIPFDEHLANLDWILRGSFDEARRPNGEVLKAYFLEMLGEDSRALEAYKRVVSTAPPYGSRAKDFAEPGIERLTSKQRPRQRQRAGPAR